MTIAPSIREIRPEALEEARKLINRYNEIRAGEGEHKWHDLGFKNENERKTAYRRAHAALAAACMNTIVKMEQADPAISADTKNHLFEAGGVEFKNRVESQGIRSLTYNNLPKPVRALMAKDVWSAAQQYLPL